TPPRLLPRGLPPPPPLGPWGAGRPFRRPRPPDPGSERDERQAHAGGLGADGGIRRCLPPDLLGEFAGVILVVGPDDQELPAPDDRPALAAELVRQRDRLAV